MKAEPGRFSEGAAPARSREHWLVGLCKRADGLAGDGHPGAWGYSPRRLVWLWHVREQERTRRLGDAAAAARVAQADEDGWKRFLGSLEG